MGNIIENRPVLQEYVSQGQSRYVAAQDEYTDEKGQKKKHWYLDGIFIQGEKQNLNGRIYPREEIHRAVTHLQEDIQEHGGVLGELDHPDTLVVNVHNVSHMITSIDLQGNDGIGRMKILHHTPSGLIVEGLLSDNVPLGVSSRGSGDVDDYTSRVSNFDIVTIDIVATPSAQDARPTPIYEKFLGNRGSHLLHNAQDVLANNDKHIKEFNDDVVNWFKTWTYKK